MVCCRDPLKQEVKLPYKLITKKLLREIAMCKINFFRIYPVICMTLFSVFLQSCATTHKIQQTKNPTLILEAPFEAVGNILEVPKAMLKLRKPNFSFGKEARFDRAWLAKDYATATRLVEDGLDLDHKVNGKSVSSLADQCVDRYFSRTVINKGGSLDDFKNAMSPLFKRAIAQDNKELINKYFYCGYPVSSYIESESLVYWAGYYVKQDIAAILDSNGVNSSRYQRGLAAGRKARINSAFAQVFTSHFLGHIFEGGNIVTAGVNELAAMSRSDGFTQIYKETFPELKPAEVKNLVIVTSLLLDGKLSYREFN